MTRRRRFSLITVGSITAMLIGSAVFAVAYDGSVDGALSTTEVESSSIRRGDHADMRRHSEVAVSETDVPGVPPLLGARAIAALPEVRYDSVIAGLLVENAEPSRVPDRTYSLRADAALYGADRVTPIGYLPAVDFLGEPTVVVTVTTDGSWMRILTPARQSLPSAGAASASAQTSAWIPAALLADGRPLADSVVVSISTQTLTILTGDAVVSTFPVGVGASATPTPTGVTGYLQARYLDPAQNQAVHRVQLTSLHATSADEPYGGSDGGLIGLHYSDIASGAVSHGCLRLDAEAIAAVDALPLGTPITIDP